MSEEQKSNGMATASLVLGIISIVLFWTGWVGIIVGVLAIIFGVVGKNKIKSNPSLASSKGKATGGLVMGVIGTILSGVWIYLILMAAAKLAEEMANRAAAFDNLKF